MMVVTKIANVMAWAVALSRRTCWTIEGAQLRGPIGVPEQRKVSAEATFSDSNCHNRFDGLQRFTMDSQRFEKIRRVPTDSDSICSVQCVVLESFESFQHSIHPLWTVQILIMSWSWPAHTAARADPIRLIETEMLFSWENQASADSLTLSRRRGRHHTQLVNTVSKAWRMQTAREHDDRTQLAQSGQFSRATAMRGRQRRERVIHFPSRI